LLASAYPLISVTSDLWDALKDSLENLGFICTDQTTPESCKSTNTCSEPAAYLETIYFEFDGFYVDDGGTSSTYYMGVTPEYYLWEDPTTGECESLITYDSDYTDEIILGDPFFRAYSIMFNYTSKNVTFMESASVSPIVASLIFPVAGDTIATTVVTVDTYQYVKGGIKIGESDAYQTNDALLFDTTS